MGSNLITSSRRVRPEYVQYAKVAKKVDVRKLKENIWKGLDLDSQAPPSTTTTPLKAGMGTDAGAGAAGLGDVPKKFSNVINNLQNVYPGNAMADISTSYCFICMLHLANEKGLILKSNETMTDIDITRDWSVQGPDEY